MNIEEFLKKFSLARIQNGVINMSYLESEEVFLVYSKKDKIILKTKNFVDAFALLSGE